LLRAGDIVWVYLETGRCDVLLADEELEARRREAPPRVPASQTPWQEIYRATVDQLHTGACLELALPNRGVATTCHVITSEMSATGVAPNGVFEQNVQDIAEPGCPARLITLGDDTMKKMIKAVGLACAMLCAAGAALADAQHPKIGFSIDDLRVERWTRDRDFFTQAAEQLGAKVYVQSADASEQRQIAQIENLISRGVDVIVIVPYNATVLNNTIREAKKARIKVVSYDRLILGADVDAYISFDNKAVGEMQAQSLVQVKPKGNYYLLGGAPTDNNAKILREGQLKVLQPLVDKGDIKIVGKQWVKDWSPAEAMSIVENALTANGNKIDAVVASNDGTAGGAIQALAAQKLAGKVVVSGQDADLAGVRRVIAGTQAMTVYKPLKQIATAAAKLSVQLVRGEKPLYNAQLDNNFKKVDTVLLKPVLLNRSNVDLLVKDGFYTQSQLAGK
jgi:D-xylose transport system substrate-binding protein